MPIRRLLNSARQGLWFMPSVWVVGSVALAFAMIELDRRAPQVAAGLPLVFGGAADGARGILTAIAGSMITVAGVTFSITIVALQLASTQQAPRVLRTFMRDRASQVLLGSFIGAFTYSILVLGSIRADADDIDPFVPSIAVGVAILYALAALGMLVYFLHHIATRIQVTTIVASVAEDALAEIRDQWPEEPEDGLAGRPNGADQPPAEVPARASGKLQLVDVDGLVRLAAEHDSVVEITVSPGGWVQEHITLFKVWPASAATNELVDALFDRISLGRQRSIEQDVAFGIRQLVDVAVKAISPGMNDPTSATDCIDRLTQLLVAAGRAHIPHRYRRDRDGHPRLRLEYPDWGELVALAYTQLRQYGAGMPDIAEAIADSLATVRVAVPAERREALEHQARLLREGAADITPAADRDRVLTATDRVLAG